MSGYLLPQVAALSSSSKAETIKSRLIVLQVEGMRMGGNLDARIKSTGCIVALKSEQKMGPFLSGMAQKLFFPIF